MALIAGGQCCNADGVVFYCAVDLGIAIIGAVHDSFVVFFEEVDCWVMFW